MKSLRTKIVLALLISSLLSAVSVGLVARWMVMRQFDKETIERVLESYHSDVVAYLTTYGSWQAALRAERLPSFIRRRRGPPELPRTPVSGQIAPGPIVNHSLPPLPSADSGRMPGHYSTRSPKLAGKKGRASPPFRFTTVDAKGNILLPRDRSHLPPIKFSPQDAKPININGEVVGYILRDAELKLDKNEQAFLKTLLVSFGYALLIVLPLLLLAGIVWGHILTKPLRRLMQATEAMREGELRQQVVVSSKDEIGRLATSFNQMSNKLAGTYSKLEQSKMNAESANHAKSAFLSSMSHELRTPLSVILGFTSLMKRDAQLSKEQQNNLNVIYRSGEHLLQLLNNVLSLSKIESGKFEITQQDFAIRDVVNDLISMFAMSAERKRLRLEVDIVSDTPIYLRSDEKLLRQILINLIGNAIKFTEQGAVSLSVEYREEQKLTFIVADTGVGIAAEELTKLFQPFVQTSSGQRSVSGTGLGLSLSRRMIESLGGSIRVDSILGEGSRFVFDIVAERVTTADKPATLQRQIIGLKTEHDVRILIVDDHADNRQLLRQLLQMVGFAVRTAVNGQQAIEAWRQWRPALIWMDLRMPVMDGVTATRRIREESLASAESPIIIALTASIFTEEEPELLAQGFDAIVRKPFKEDIIFAAIARHLAVEYRYSQLSDDIENEMDMDLSNIKIANQPEEWYQALTEACQQADYFRLQDLIEELPTQQSQLAARMKRLLADYDYEALHSLTTA